MIEASLYHPMFIDKSLRFFTLAVKYSSKLDIICLWPLRAATVGSLAIAIFEINLEDFSRSL